MRNAVHDAALSAFSELLGSLDSPSFVESVDVAINLVGLDLRRPEDQVKGCVKFPHGIGREIKVLVLKEDKEGGSAIDADLAGGEELIQEIAQGRKVDEFDWCVTTPPFMQKVSIIAKVLGPRGLMPSPKFGTVTQDVEGTVKSLKGGVVRFKVDKGGVIHSKLGNISFSAAQLCDNYMTLLEVLFSSKPSSVKGNFVGRSFISTTMGKSVLVGGVAR